MDSLGTAVVGNWSGGADFGSRRPSNVASPRSARLPRVCVPVSQRNGSGLVVTSSISSSSAPAIDGDANFRSSEDLGMEGSNHAPFRKTDVDARGLGRAARARPGRLKGGTRQKDWSLPAMATTGLERAEPVQTPEVDKLLDTIKWNSNGLVVAIAQDIDTGAILMQGFANRDAVSATLASRRATFFSRSRSSLWTKGESSRNFINVVDVYLDCDRDSIIYLGSPDGPTCHTGAETCYFVSAAASSEKNAQALSTLYSLEATIDQRKAETSTKLSWTKKLVESPKLLCSKIREEADELCRTIEKSEGRDRTVSEMADLLYHSMVLLAVQDVKVKEVLEVLRGRFSKSGIEEKKSRSSS